MQFTPAMVNSLRNLLTPADEAEEFDDAPASATAKLNPGMIGPRQKKEKKKVQESQPANPDDIWQEDDIVEGTEYDDIYDARPTPDHDIFFKQAVTTEDIYLQLGNKNPTTSSCEFMVVRVNLPGTKLDSIVLDVKDKYLDLRCPRFKLGLHLPNPVDPKSAKAEWNNAKATMTVTMRNKREFDEFNF